MLRIIMIILALGAVSYVVRQAMQDSRNRSAVEAIFAPREQPAVVLRTQDPDLVVRPRR